MKYFKDAYKGIILIILLLGFNAFMWLIASPIFDQPIESTVAQIGGSSILLMFSMVFFLSTRNRLINWLFSGLENVYTTHRFLGVFSLLFIFLHGQTAHLIIMQYRGDIPFDAASMGPLARNLFIALIIVAPLAKYFKYEHWRILHRFMFVPYLLAVYHSFFLSSYELLTISPLAIWMNFVVLVGIGSSIYMLIIYRHVAFKHEGKIKAIQHVSDNVTEVEVKLNNPLQFKTGQFVFIKIDKAPFKGSPHPFSISGNTEDSVFFSIKSLGDFTEDIANSLSEGDTIRVSKAYGHMTFDDYSSPQVWVAGGIGLTPFIGHLRSLSEPPQDITLYYTVRNKKEAAYLEDLKSLAAKWDNFNLKYYESDTDGFLKAEDFDIEDGTNIFMCGPIPMARALKKEFKKINADFQLVYEAFSFTGTLAQDVENIFRRLTKSHQ